MPANPNMKTIARRAKSTMIMVSMTDCEKTVKRARKEVMRIVGVLVKPSSRLSIDPRLRGSLTAT